MLLTVAKMPSGSVVFVLPEGSIYEYVEGGPIRELEAKQTEGHNTMASLSGGSTILVDAAGDIFELDKNEMQRPVKSARKWINLVLEGATLDHNLVGHFHGSFGGELTGAN